MDFLFKKSKKGDIKMEDSLSVNSSEKERGIVLDVREKEEYESGHIPGSQSVPLSLFPNILDTLEKDKDYYLVCRSGGRSLLGCRHMKQNGFNSRNLKGGMNAYTGSIEK